MIFQHVSMWHSNALIIKLKLLRWKKEAPVEMHGNPLCISLYDLLTGGQLLKFMNHHAVAMGTVLLAEVIHVDVWLSDSTWPGGIHLWTGLKSVNPWTWMIHSSREDMDGVFLVDLWIVFKWELFYIWDNLQVTCHILLFCWWITFTCKGWWH